MKKIISFLLIIATISNGAKVKFTTEKTSSYKEDRIVYRNKKHVKTGTFDNVLLNDATVQEDREGLFRQTVGFDLSELRYLHIDTDIIGDDLKKYEDNASHLTGVFRGFALGYGNSLNNIKNRLYNVSNLTLGMFGDGIVSTSVVISYGSRAFWSSEGIYFGNVINELSAGTHGSRRFYSDDTDNRNLFISALANSSSYAETDVRNTDAAEEILYPSFESFAMPMYGTEVQKLMRAETVMVKEFECGTGKGVKALDIRNRAIEGMKLDFDGKLSNTVDNTRCSISGKKDRTVAPLLSRTNTIAANGQVYNGKFSLGTSFAAPRTAGVARAVQEKFEGITYHQIKQILLTTAYREEDRLDNLTGWGLLDRESALKGPMALNAGLIEEGKFFTGNYDKVMGDKGNVYFYADVNDTTWNWSNDIYGNLRGSAYGESRYTVALNNTGSDGEAGYPFFTAGVIEDVNVANVVPSEYNFYEETSKYKPGLRKAGNGNLVITGNLYYNGKTEVLQGNLDLNSHVPYSGIYVYEGANLYLRGKSYASVNNLGGRVRILGDVEIKELMLYENGVESILTISTVNDIKIDKIIATPQRIERIKNVLKTMPRVKVGKYVEINPKLKYEDIEINEYKAADIKKEYFFSGFGSVIKEYSTGNESALYRQLVSRYGTLGNAPEEVKKYVPGYRNGYFSVEYDKDFDATDETEFFKKPNTVWNRRKGKKARNIEETTHDEVLKVAKEYYNK